MQKQRLSLALSSEASYCEKETFEGWGSRSSLSYSQVDEIASQSTHDDAAALKAERDALAKSLAAERARSSALSRAHDARLAELHGVIAELMRRRAEDKRSGAIPEETSDGEECESTTQPAEELENDAEVSQTDQNDTSSQLSPSLGLNGQMGPKSLSCDPKIIQENSIQTDTETDVNQDDLAYHYETSLDLSERDENDGCCRYSGQSAGSCEREQGSLDDKTVMRQPGNGRPESRQAKLASRVRLRKTSDQLDEDRLTNDEVRCAERLALNVCAQADLREAIVASEDDPSVLRARLSLSQCSVSRLQAELTAKGLAINRADDTAYRLYVACTSLESSVVKLCSALSSADRALEAYDVLLALAESGGECDERASAEQIANQLLKKLEEEETPRLGAPLMTSGPWMNHQFDTTVHSPWDSAKESSLRAHAARLKALTAAARGGAPRLYSRHDLDDIDIPAPVKPVSNAEMENAVMLQELALAREQRAAALAALVRERASGRGRGEASTGRKYTKPKHWLEQSAETDL